MKRKRNCEQTYRTHSTEMEIKFIENLGSFAPDVGYENKLSREQLQTNYYKAAKKRKVWGDIDRERIINYMFQKIYCGDVVK